MKKIIKKSLNILMVLFFALVILSTLATRVLAQTSSENYKIAPVVSDEVASDSADREVLEDMKVDYFLAYPGILPDHFLYPLKMIRDRLRAWLTIDPAKKAELFLLYADKRLGAGKVLIEGNKIDLGVSTLTKGEKYLNLALDQAKLGLNKGKEVQDVLQKIKQASLKHEEILLDLQDKVGQDLQSVINETTNYTKQVQERSSQFLNQ